MCIYILLYYVCDCRVSTMVYDENNYMVIIISRARHVVLVQCSIYDFVIGVIFGKRLVRRCKQKLI